MHRFRTLSLIRIFAAGPIAGFAASTALPICGFLLSDSTVLPDGEFLILGDSLLTLAVQAITFPGIAENQEVMLHPVDLAGYFGLSFNLWNLFPAGRLDGGRIVYALFGYRRALVVNWVTIGILMVIRSHSSFAAI
jgi:membrane-associated protease RseP (regulator of RpoE activity)